jgi:hypothetical protein
MAATEPRPTAGTYVEPTGMNTAAATTAYPSQWAQPPTATPGVGVVPSAAFDELEQSWDAGTTSTLADDAHESTLD